MTDERKSRIKDEVHCPECESWHRVRIDWGACDATSDPRVLIIRYGCRACDCLFECEHTRTGDLFVTDHGDRECGEPLTDEEVENERKLDSWKESHA